MRLVAKLGFLLTLSGILLAANVPGVEPLPDAVSNNAVAVLRKGSDLELFSFMGLGAKKTWDSVTNAAYELDAYSGKTNAIHPVPGTAGRIGASAIGVGDRVFLFGGYVVYQGGGMVVPDLNIYEPAHDRWVRGADIPIPVGDAVIGVYRDRYIYLLGGRSNQGLISDAQVYDVEKSRWEKATSLPGTPVFGHAGAIVDDTVVYVDGAQANPADGKPKFVASDECWKGKIDHHDPRKIEWTKLPPHPGNARYRTAAGEASGRDPMIYFSGGTDNPYDFAGMGYDGKPAEPSPVTFAYNLRSGKWETIDANTPDPTMDHHGLVVTPDNLVILGGMEKGQQVTAKVQIIPRAARTK